MSFRKKGHRKSLKGDSDVTRENVHSKDRGVPSSEVAESAAKESTFIFYSPLFPLPRPLVLSLCLSRYQPFFPSYVTKFEFFTFFLLVFIFHAPKNLSLYVTIRVMKT